MIDTTLLEQYKGMLGADKMRNLFKEYLAKLDTDLPKIVEYIAKNDLISLRITYHSLASASLVFGMKEFAQYCRKIEEMILQGKELKEIKPCVEEANKLLNAEKKEVEKELK